MIPLLLACASPGSHGVVTVLAASSLTEAYTDLETAFEAEHPGVDVQLSFAGSQTLATQIRHGIRADVFASANEPHLLALEAEGLAGTPSPFAAGSLVLVVGEAEAPLALETLTRVGSLVLGGEDVPVGRYTARLLDAAEDRYGADWRREVDARIVSREPNVRLVLAKVRMGEADAAVVYETDAAIASRVRTVPLPRELVPEIAYHHALLVAAPAPELAAEWMAFVQSPMAERILTARGFRIGPGGS